MNNDKKDEWTHIRIRNQTKDILDSKKIHPNQSYNEIIEYIIFNNKWDGTEKNIEALRQFLIDNKGVPELKDFFIWGKKNKFLMRFWIKCEICNNRRAIQYHHKDKNKKNNVYENAQLLCRLCHRKVHNRFNPNEKHSRGIKNISNKKYTKEVDKHGNNEQSV